VSEKFLTESSEPIIFYVTAKAFDCKFINPVSVPAGFSDFFSGANTSPNGRLGYPVKSLLDPEHFLLLGDWVA
jgi:hypothetical protein